MSLALLLSGEGASARAGECCCAQCGAQRAQQVCRLVPDEKKVTVTCWGYQDETICLPGPSTPGGLHEETVCADCDPAGKTSFLPKRFAWREWCPGGAPEALTKRKLMKRTVTKKIPGYKWVLDELCPACVQACAQAKLPADAPIPPVPALPPGVALAAPPGAKTPQPEPLGR